MKKIFLLIVLFSALTLCGCDSLTFSVDGLMSAPSIADEQAAVHQALIESVGKSVTLCYPRSGDYRSAFVFADIDSDGSDEALAFYTSTQAGGSENVRVSVLDSDGDGSWHAMYELAGRGSSIDTVMIADYGDAADIIIGYGTSLHGENNVSVYRYGGGMLASRFDGTYSVLEMADIDNCGSEEIIIVRRVGDNVSVSIIKSSDGVDYQTMERTLYSSAASIASSRFGGLTDSQNAMFIDLINEEGEVSTEVVTLVNGAIVSPTSDNPQLSWLTMRPSGYLSADYDGDGIVEIPTVSPFLGYGYTYQPEVEPVYMTGWLSYSLDIGMFSVEAFSYYDVGGGYVFTIPQRWENFVTAVKSEQAGEISFVKYDYDAGSIADMPKLLSIAAVSSGSKNDWINNGYSYVAGDDFVSCMSKTLAGADEPLLLTQDEIRNNLYYIS